MCIRDSGLLDAVVDRRELRNVIGVLLDLLGPSYRLEMTNKNQHNPNLSRSTTAWNSVELARHNSRPTASDYMRLMFTNFVELHGDRSHSDDQSIICGIAQLAGQTIVAIGQQKRPTESNPAGKRTGPEGFRKAQRAMRLADKFQLPLVTLSLIHI